MLMEKQTAGNKIVERWMILIEDGRIPPQFHSESSLTGPALVSRVHIGRGLGSLPI